MSQPNSSVAYNDWSKLPENNTNFTEKLEKLNKVRESLFSKNGWSSKNVIFCLFLWFFFFEVINESIYFR